MPRFLSTGSLKISCVKITASSGMSMAPALKSKPFIAANGSMAEDSSDIPTAEAPLKCIISPTITIGRNTHSRKTISFFVFIGFSKFRFVEHKSTKILIEWQINTWSKEKGFSASMAASVKSRCTSPNLTALTERMLNVSQFPIDTSISKPLLTWRL